MPQTLVEGWLKIARGRGDDPPIPPPLEKRAGSRGGHWRDFLWSGKARVQATSCNFDLATGERTYGTAATITAGWVAVFRSAEMDSG